MLGREFRRLCGAIACVGHSVFGYKAAGFRLDGSIGLNV